MAEYRRLACTTRKFFVLLLFLSFRTAPALAMDPSPPPPEEDGWDRLNLPEQRIEGVRVYVEVAVAEKFPDYAERLGAILRKHRASMERFRAELPNIRGMLLRIFSIDEADPIREKFDMKFQAWTEKAKQLDQMRDDLRVYLVSKKTVVEHIRSGTRLKNITYSESTNSGAFSYYVGAHSENGKEVIHGLDVVPLVLDLSTADAATLDGMYEKLDGIFRLLGPCVILHEIVEQTTFARLRGRTAINLRWFTDGLATALAERILTKIGVLVERPNSWFDPGEVAQYELMKKDINLRYWQFQDVGMVGALRQVMDTREKSSGDPDGLYEQLSLLQNARYYYSYLEFKGLMDRHGEDFLPVLMDQIRTTDAMTPVQLATMIGSAAGEDMNARLDAYQQGKSAEEAFGYHKRLYEELCKANQYDQAMMQLLLMSEADLTTGRINPEFLRQFTNILVQTKRYEVALESLKAMRELKCFESTKALIDKLERDVRKQIGLE